MEQKSLINHAYDVLNESKTPMSFKDLFNEAIKRAGLKLNEDQTKTKMASLYSQLVVDGRFASLSKGNWDLCSRYKYDEVHQKVEEDYDEEGYEEELDEEEKKYLKAELGEDDDGSEEDDGEEEIDFDKPKIEPEDDF